MNGNDGNTVPVSEILKTEIKTQLAINMIDCGRNKQNTQFRNINLKYRLLPVEMPNV